MKNRERSLVEEQWNEWEGIFNACFDGVWVTDGEGRTIMVNQAYEQLANIKKEDVIGKYVQDLLEASVLSQSSVPEVIKTQKPVTIINKMNNKSLLVSGVPVFRNQKLHRIVCTVRDISQLTELQKEIEKKNELIIHYEAEMSKYKDMLDQIEGGPVVRNSKNRKLFELAEQVASTSSTVIIKGESGVGKEVLANWIHQRSPRRNKPFIKVNCSAIPESLMESELFGYEQGAFTGAHKRKAGLFELADQGTIFLDEIGDLPPNMQAKLLRVLQDKEVRRVGGGKPVSIDVRVISATNRSLEKMISKGLFREDLYYRLNVIPFVLPPLRERKEEIPILAAHFLTQFNRMYERKVEIGPVVIQRMMQYNWPGNIRELKNMIERLVVMSSDEQMSLELFSDYIEQTHASSPDKPGGLLHDLVNNFEKQLICDSLGRSKSIRQAAKMLGVSHSTLVRKIQFYDINYQSMIGTELQML